MASKGVNKVILIGHIGSDPEVYNTKGGDKIVNLSLATSESWKDKDGKQEQRTEWHKVKCFKKLAEIAESYVRKGSKLYVEGSLRTSKWAKDGVDHYTTEVIVANLQMLDSKPTEGREAKTTAKQYAMATGAQDFDDEIPF